jgi:osmotically inducible lipoprotein OsmB
LSSDRSGTFSSGATCLRNRNILSTADTAHFFEGAERSTLPFRFKPYSSAIEPKEFVMRSLLKAGMLMLTLAAMPVAAQAGTLEGAAIGAGSGMLIAGPPGAIVGGVIGATVGGPNIVRHQGYRGRNCWTNRYGQRRCNWR